MKLLKVGMASVNTTVGAVKTNTLKLCNIAAKMAEDKCDVGVFQEGAIGGYHAEDLNTWKQMRRVQAKYLRLFVESTANDKYPTVYFVGVTIDHEGRAVNCVAVVSQGKIWAFIPKLDLPGNGVFYDPRVFDYGVPTGYEMVIPYEGHEPVAYGNVILNIRGTKVSSSVCETIWHPKYLQILSYNGSIAHFNVSASPFRNGVFQTLNEMLSTRSADSESLVVYSSQVGAQDGLVFHGYRAAFQNGRAKFATKWEAGWDARVFDLEETEASRSQNVTWARLRSRHFEENERLHVVQIPYPEGFVAPEHPIPVEVEGQPFLPPEKPVLPEINIFDDLEEALVTGLGDYFEKVGKFECLLIADSGGVDSQLVKFISWLYAKRRFAVEPDDQRAEKIREFVRCYSMPTKFNKAATKNIARYMSEQFGVHFEEHSIQEEYEQDLKNLQAMLPPGKTLSRLTRQNIQPRIRGKRMMNLANALGGLFLNTGNQTEKGGGYTTVGGDTLGGKAVISNLPKTLVYALIKYLGKKYSIDVHDVVTIKASAELEDNQEDENELGPFPVVDTILEVFVGNRADAVTVYKVLRAKFSDEYLLKIFPKYKQGMLKVWTKSYLTRFFTNVFKWVITPEGIHVGAIELDRERALQIPTVTSLEWLELDELDAVA